MSMSELSDAFNQAKDSAADSPAGKESKDLARRIERALQEGFDSLRSRARDYSDAAGEKFDAAHGYVAARAKERPLAITGASFGAGVLVGFLVCLALERR